MTVSGSAWRTTRVRKRRQQRVAELDHRPVGGVGVDRREPEADDRRDQRDDEARPRPGGADVEERAAIREARADADEGAERAEREDAAAPAGSRAATRRTPWRRHIR